VEAKPREEGIMKTEFRVALVTGASSGLGWAVARLLASSSWTVGIVARRRNRLEELAEEIRRAGGRAIVLPGDLRDGPFAARVVEDLVSQAGQLDLLVNNAGAPTQIGTQGPAGDVPDTVFDAAFALNVRSAYRLSHAALHHLETTRGSIVNVTSAGVARNLPMDIVYLTSKGALEVLSRGLAKKWAPRGVRVNVVSPGMIPTEILRVAGLSDDDGKAELARARKAYQPLPVDGRPQDIAQAVAYLASDAAAFVTGATLQVDGGMGLGG
jgi:NAD(P)-dependent dehydrogenase (short-subunit alcohol dehydrogenase family)